MRLAVVVFSALICMVQPPPVFKDTFFLGVVVDWNFELSMVSSPLFVSYKNNTFEMQQRKIDLLYCKASKCVSDTAVLLYSSFSISSFCFPCAT
ncbi:unnamed protein product [Linum trigynum]|uniref:Secreted protein n=1 Tax=Linum trigynum TaxID=586398 RepID=A0AAV2EVK9_9ROSI